MVQYTNTLKQSVCEAICRYHKSTIETAEHYNVPLKTVEKWVTTYNKDPEYFAKKADITPADIILTIPAGGSTAPAGGSTAPAGGSIRRPYHTHPKKAKEALKKYEYSNMSNEELQLELMKRDVELARLKKGYVVRKSGGRLEYGTF